MKLQRTFQFSPALFGLLPLLNVLVLLLVFFVMSSRFLLQPGIEISLPVTAFALGPQRNAHVVSLTAGPQSTIYFEEKALGIDALGKALSAIHEADRTLIIKADRNTPHELVVDVMNQGLRAGFTVLIASDTER